MKYGGQLYRFGQDCGLTYGHRVSVCCAMEGGGSGRVGGAGRVGGGRPEGGGLNESTQASSHELFPPRPLVAPLNEMISIQIRAFRIKTLDTERYDEEEVPFAVNGTLRVGFNGGEEGHWYQGGGGGAGGDTEDGW